MKKQILILAALALAAGGCKEADTANTLTDSRDGKKYKTVQIGEQVWMAENLNYEAQGSKCYEDDPANCDTYGRLYDWETAKKACPAGWHLPSKDEWEVMTAYIGGERTEGKKLKTKSGWKSSEEYDSNGTDEFGFSALPGGYGHASGSFYGVGDRGDWWSTIEYNINIAYHRGMHNIYGGGNANWGFDDKDNLYSVRCVKDK